MTPALSTQLSIGYLSKATSASFDDAGGEEIKNNRLPFTSKCNITAQADHVVKLSSGQFNLQVNADYQSEFYFDQNPFAKQYDYILCNARVAWEKVDWTFEAWVKNLTDVKYSHLKCDLVDLFGMLQYFKGQARQISLDVHYEF